MVVKVVRGMYKQVRGFIFQSADPIKREIANKRREAKLNYRNFVTQINDEGEEIMKFDSLKEASIKTGVSKTTISRICEGKSGYLQGKDFSFKYTFPEKISQN